MNFLSLARQAVVLLALAFTAGLRAQSGGSGNPAVPIKGTFDDPQNPLSSLAPGNRAISLVYVPPTLPPFDRALDGAGDPGRPALFPAPRELAEYTSEPFYSPLGLRLQGDDLSRRQRDALARYRDDRRTLRDELGAALDRILALPPDARAAELGTLARAQEPKIADLEKRAEELRAALFDSERSWNERREWHLGDSAPRQPDTAKQIALVFNILASDQPGFSAEQRALLREIAIEVPTGAGSAEAAVAVQPYVFFLPSPARVLFPDDLPAELGAKIAVFQTKKSALRKQLYDAVLAEEKSWPGLTRTAHFKALAREQAPEFAGLELMAEEIRRDLARRPARPAPPATLLPASVAARATTFFQRQAAAQKEEQAAVAALRVRYPALRISVFQVRGRFLYTVFPRSVFDDRTKAEAAQKAAAAELEALAAAHDATQAAEKKERRDLEDAVADAIHSEDLDKINAALAEAARNAVVQNAAGALRDYRVAVFEPGLSPGQRRLLLGLAMTELDPPLPEGESPSWSRPGLKTTRGK